LVVGLLFILAIFALFVVRQRRMKQRPA